MLKLYGVLTSRASRNAWLLYETGTPFERIPVVQAYRLADPDGSGHIHTRSPAFLSLSPQGAVPVLVDGDLVLSESLAINLHLARKFGGDLGPRDAAELALMEQWALYGMTAIEDRALGIMFAVRDGVVDTPQGRPAVDAARSALVRPLRVVDAHLAGGFMVGGRFTVADINMVEIVRYADTLPGLIADYPNIAAWLAECRARPAFQRMWAERAAEVI